MKKWLRLSFPQICKLSCMNYDSSKLHLHNMLGSFLEIDSHFKNSIECYSKLKKVQFKVLSESGNELL